MEGKHGGTLVFILLQDLKVPSSNLDKTKNLSNYKLSLRFKITPYCLCVFMARDNGILGIFRVA